MTAPSLPDLAGHFGRYGGRFVPEALVRALDELDAAYRSAKTDPVFQAEFESLLVNYAGVSVIICPPARSAIGRNARLVARNEPVWPAGLPWAGDRGRHAAGHQP